MKFRTNRTKTHKTKYNKTKSKHCKTKSKHCKTKRRKIKHHKTKRRYYKKGGCFGTKSQDDIWESPEEEEIMKNWVKEMQMKEAAEKNIDLWATKQDYTVEDYTNYIEDMKKRGEMNAAMEAAEREKEVQKETNREKTIVGQTSAVASGIYDMGSNIVNDYQFDRNYEKQKILNEKENALIQQKYKEEDALKLQKEQEDQQIRKEQEEQQKIKEQEASIKFKENMLNTGRNLKEEAAIAALPQEEQEQARLNKIEADKKRELDKIEADKKRELDKIEAEQNRKIQQEQQEEENTRQEINKKQQELDNIKNNICQQYKSLHSGDKPNPVNIPIIDKIIDYIMAYYTLIKDKGYIDSKRNMEYYNLFKDISIKDEPVDPAPEAILYVINCDGKLIDIWKEINVYLKKINNSKLSAKFNKFQHDLYYWTPYGLYGERHKCNDYNLQDEFDKPIAYCNLPYNRLNISDYEKIVMKKPIRKWSGIPGHKARDCSPENVADKDDVDCYNKTKTMAGYWRCNGAKDCVDNWY